MLTDLQSKSEQAIRTSEVVKDVVNEQAISVLATEEKYKEITEGIRTSLIEIDNILQISEEMEGNRVKVNEVVEGLAAIAEENAASTEETSASAEQMLASMIEVEGSSKKLNELSSQLEEHISAFDLERKALQTSQKTKKPKKNKSKGKSKKVKAPRKPKQKRPMPKWLKFGKKNRS